MTDKLRTEYASLNDDGSITIHGIQKEKSMFLDNVKWEALTKKEAEDIWNEMSGAEKEVLLQFRSGIKWDGFISSKYGRDSLISAGLAMRFEGFSTISNHGLILLQTIGKLDCLTNGEVK